MDLILITADWCHLTLGNYWDSTPSNEDVTTKTINLRTKHVARDMELSVTFQSLKLGAHASLFIVQNQCFYYNIINVSNYLPH
jgi:hypothetical protein